MKWEQKQSKIEEMVQDSIEHLAEELKLNIPYYPQVIWVGKKQFEDFKLNEEYKKGWETIKKLRISLTYPPSPGLILIGHDSPDHIYEESAHFIHFANSKIDKFKTESYETQYKEIIQEILGFFGAKLIDPSIKNEVNSTQNYSRKKSNKITEDRVYQEGYLLGEIMFYAFVQGNIEKKFVSDLFKNPLDKEGSAIRKLKHIKKKLQV